MSSKTRSTTAVAVLLSLAAHTSAAAGAPAKPRPCGDIASSQGSTRNAQAPTGTEFVREIQGRDDDERESAILSQALSGNFPSFLRHADPVELKGRSAEGAPITVTLCVWPDYLAIGSDSDYLFVPMRLSTAIAVANRYDALLPTRKMVDAIYDQAQVRLQPQPLPASDTMRTTGYYWHHSELVRVQRSSFDAPPGALTAGDKKDLVLTNRFWTYPTRVAIYGWHVSEGKPIQPLSTVHGARYADYSHGVRLVSAVAYVNGVALSLLELLQDPKLAHVLSDEGVLRNAGDLLRVLATRLTASPGCRSVIDDCLTPHEIKEVPIIGEPEEARSQLTSPFPINLTHAFDQMLHH